MLDSLSVKAVYSRLSGNEVNDVDDKGALLPKHCNPTQSRQKRSWTSSPAVHIAVIGSELVLLAILLVGYILLHSRTDGSVPADEALDGLLLLAGTYNTSMTFHNQSDLLRSSEEADVYWARLLESGGVVSLDTESARQSGLRESAISPTDPSQSIYQVDIFHALHCMVSHSHSASVRNLS